MGVFRLTMNEASEGDALLLAWGDNEASLHHALIDLGRTGDYKALKAQIEAIGTFELFVITHIDADHIEGAMPLIKAPPTTFAPKDVWFNAWHHLANAEKRKAGDLETETLSVAQGEKLSDGIVKHYWPWNRAFAGGPVSFDSLPTGSSLLLAGGLRITLLSPADEELVRLKKVWDKWLKKEGIRRTDSDDLPKELAPELETLSGLNVEALALEAFEEDDAEPNGSSIAFLAEYDGKSVLFGADAFPGVIERSLRALGYDEANRLKVDLFKVCHHGSRRNTSPDLLKIIDCSRFAFSTDGSHHDHPDRQTIARILKNGDYRKKTLIFNTFQKHTNIWNNSDLCAQYNYCCLIAPKGKPGIAIDV